MADPAIQVVHVNVSSHGGGAAIAMQSLHAALASLGVGTQVVARNGRNSQDVISWPDPSVAARKEIQRRLVWADRTELSNSEFSLDLFGVDLTRCKALCDADVIHLHWIAGYLSSKSLIELAGIGKPVVWTLHDIHPLAGGCHFPAGCHKWESGCHDCPQLRRDPHDLARLQAAAQRRALEVLQPTLVAPSRWMADLASRSKCSRGLRVEHVPYGVDTATFLPVDRGVARRRLGLPQDERLVLLSCQSFREQRKGFEQAMRIWEEVRGLLKQEKSGAPDVRLLLCGDLPSELALRLPPGAIPLGFVSDRSVLVDIYSAADALLFTSLEDNLPNVLLEAASCGLPACVFPVGGVVDVVGDGETGVYLDPSDPSAAARSVQKLMRQCEMRGAMGRLARQRMEETFSLAGQALRMEQLYRQIVSEGPRPRSPGVLPPLEGASVISAALLNNEVPAQAVEEALPLFLARAAGAVSRRVKRVVRLQTNSKRGGASARLLFPVAVALQKRLYRFHQYPPKNLVHRPLPGPKFASLPSFSIVTPTFNGGRFLDATIQSIASQVYPKLDYVVQDGGSTDDTGEILSRWADRGVRCFSEPDSGQANAINKGFARSGGEIMAWVNSDDLLVPGCLAFVGSFFACNPGVDVVYGHRIVVDTEGREVGRWWSPAWNAKSIEFYDYVAQETIFWRRRVWERLEPCGVDEGFQFAMDWDLLARMKDAGARVVRLPQFLGIFRVHDAQKTACLIDSVGRREMAAIRSRYRTTAAWDREVPGRLVRDLGGVLATKWLWKAGLRW